MFSQAATDPTLADKAIYSTLIRLGPPFNKLGKALVEVFKHFQWKKAVLISRRKVDEKKVFCDYSSRSMEKAFRENNITLADWTVIGDNIDQNSIDDLLQRITMLGRSMLCLNCKRIYRKNLRF